MDLTCIGTYCAKCPQKSQHNHVPQCGCSRGVQGRSVYPPGASFLVYRMAISMQARRSLTCTLWPDSHQMRWVSRGECGAQVCRLASSLRCSCQGNFFCALRFGQQATEQSTFLSFVDNFHTCRKHGQKRVTCRHALLDVSLFGCRFPLLRPEAPFTQDAPLHQSMGNLTHRPKKQTQKSRTCHWQCSATRII